MKSISQQISALSREEKRVLLARLIEKRANDTKVFNLSFAQERLWFIDQLVPGDTSYNIPTALRVSGALDVSTLVQSVNEVIRRHESLRTIFSTKQERPLQLIAPSLSVSVPTVSLQGIPRDDRETEVSRLADQEARRPFDLARALDAGRPAAA